jgi:hypothetical protein
MRLKLLFTGAGFTRGMWPWAVSRRAVPVPEKARAAAAPAWGTQEISR